MLEFAIGFCLVKVVFDNYLYSCFRQLLHNAKQPAWGIAKFLPVSELHDPSKGYLVNDTCLVEVDVSTDKTVDLLSDEFEPEEFTEEEIDTFCTSLESELVNYRIYSPEEAKEALAKNRASLAYGAG